MADPPAARPSDAQLFAGIAAGDAESLRRLMGRYDRLVRYTVYRTSRDRCRRDPEWLDSVASEVWTDVVRGCRTGAGGEVSNVHSYFIQVARRRCIDGLRRAGRSPASTTQDEPNESQHHADQEDIGDTLVRLEEMSALRHCVERLDEADRRLCGELTAITAGRWCDAAGRLAMPESTLRSRWKRVLEALRACMQAKAGG